MVLQKQYAKTHQFQLITLAILGILAILVLVAPNKAQNRLSGTLRGEIKDEFGGLIIGATLNLKNIDGETRKTVTNKTGNFKFENLDFGKYSLEISATGFAEHSENIEVKPGDSKRHSITLYPTIRADVEVARNSKLNILDSEEIAGTIVLKKKQLEDLPDDPEELSEQLQNLAATGGSAPGTAIVTVDGFLNEGRLPSKSAIREVRINPNLFSAQYNFPPFRGGRIEITTKPGSGSLRGAAFFNFNDESLNARNPFAETRAQTQTKRFGFQVGAPIIKNKSGFFVDLEKRDIDESSTVNSIILDDNFQTSNFTVNVPNPRRLIIGSARNDWQIGKNHSLIFRYGFNSNKVAGQNIGGLSLPERGTDYKQTEHTFRFSETAVINAKTVNEFRIGLTFRDTKINALSDKQTISVAGSFTSGGANQQEFSLDETDIEISDYLITEVGKHILKIGTQIFRYGTNELRRDNQNGTFFFGGGQIGEEQNPIFISGLEQYRRTLLSLPGGIPTRFSVNQGKSFVSTNQWRFAGFIQDEWRLSRKILISLGLRAEAQTAPSDRIRFAPRLSIALSPDKKQNWALRARTGVFYNRISDALFLSAGRLDGFNQERILIDNPTFPDPFLGGNLVNPVSARRVIDPNIKAPGSLMTRVEIQRKFAQGWSVSSSYSWSRSWSQLRSRNINAPLVNEVNPNPLTSPRPFGTSENILQFESSGKLRGKVLYVGVNQNTYKLFSINAGYLNFDFKSDTDGAFSFPQSSYDFAGELAAPFWQTRHLVFLSARINLPKKIRLSTSLNASSGRQFNITTGQDNNGDGIFNDRPNLTTSTDGNAIQTSFGFLNPNVLFGSLRRNVGTNPAAFRVNINLRRTFILRKNKEGSGTHRLTTNIRIRNLLNRTNLNGFNGVLNSPFFGRAFSARPARRIEFGLRLSF